MFQNFCEKRWNNANELPSCSTIIINFKIVCKLQISSLFPYSYLLFKRTAIDTSSVIITVQIVRTT